MPTTPFSQVPTLWIDNYDYSAPNITIPLASFPAISEIEANTVTGDIRAILYGICQALADKWYDNVATSSNPTKMTITRSSSVNASSNAITRTFTFRFVTSVPESYEDIAPES